jgi:ribosomal protein S18 acetylase RimI-like enzyme
VTEIEAGGRVQLGDRLLGPAAEAGLERSGERQRERVGGYGVRAGSEIAEALLVELGGHELAREHGTGAATPTSTPSGARRWVPCSRSGVSNSDTDIAGTGIGLLLLGAGKVSLLDMGNGHAGSVLGVPGAATRTGAIAGTLLLEGPGADTVFTPMLGPAAGTIGCAGIAPPRHGQGIGTALVVRASQILSQAGVRACRIGWTTR